MAQKTQVVLVDDLDGGDAEESVSFALDGASYEIDLSAGNAEGLREALAPYVGHARRVSGRGGRTRASAVRPTTGRRADLSEVRVWARENGYEISDRGRISGDVIEAYEAAH